MRKPYVGIGGKVIVSYPVKEVDFALTKGEFNVIRKLYSLGEKVQAIKFLREQHNIGLYEAKQICDSADAMGDLE